MPCATKTFPLHTKRVSDYLNADATSRGIVRFRFIPMTPPSLMTATASAGHAGDSVFSRIYRPTGSACDDACYDTKMKKRGRMNSAAMQRTKGTRKKLVTRTREIMVSRRPTVIEKSSMRVDRRLMGTELGREALSGSKSWAERWTNIWNGWLGGTEIDNFTNHPPLSSDRVPAKPSTRKKFCFPRSIGDVPDLKPIGLIAPDSRGSSFNGR